MKFPLKWLQIFVDPGVPVEVLAHRLTMAGLEVEKIEHIGAEWDHVYVGSVLEVSRHPDADRLVLADVEAGEHRLTVVTGAPNIAAGQKVALALAGASLIDGHSDSGERRVLKPTKMRGILSAGMVCSEKELGLSGEHEGILVLEDTAPVGAPLREWLGDTVLEFEITPNLVHNFSVLGIAREVGAIFDCPVSMPAGASVSSLATNDPGLVTIEDSDLCPRYMGIVFENVTVEPSPAWLARRLTSAGLRPVNNLVDITNLVMLEIGQPLHAFDRGRLSEGRVIVRRAKPGETMETLDHQHRQLPENALMIADASQAVAIAGVMGGVDSEVTSETNTILLEGANFDMKSVRHTSRALKLRTDASARFERGLDPNLVGLAMARATRLLLETCPGIRLASVCDVYPEPVKAQTLTMPYSRIEQVLGIEIPRDQALDALTRLEFQPCVAKDDPTLLTVTVPTYRHDVSIPDDIVEEIARIVGYESLPSTLPMGRAVPVNRDPIYQLQSSIRHAVTASGVSEAVTYVTVSQDMLSSFSSENGITAGLLLSVPFDHMLRIRNPMQSDRSLLRVTLIPSMLEPVAANLKHSPAASFFEFARLYNPNGPDQLPDEVECLGIVMAGNREPLSVYQTAGELDFFDLKGVVETVLERAGVENSTFEPWAHSALHPGRNATVSHAGQTIGVLGELRPDVAASFGIDGTRVCAAELNVNALLAAQSQTRRDVRVPRHLPARQDFAIVVDESTPAGDVAWSLRKAGGQLVTDVDLFDVYRGTQLGENKKSLAYRVTFTAPDRALTDDDLVNVRKRIERSLMQDVGGVLRA
ncbi:phenylalanine--tRNA ligase subunit beta [soil metagenome]